MRKSTNAPLRDLGAVLLVVCPLSPRVLADDGTIVFCGNQGDLPSEFGTATVHDHWPGYLLPGFVDSHIHFPQTYAGDSYAGGQLLEWLNLCVFPSEAKFADPEFAAQAAVEFINRRIAAGTTAAVVCGSIVVVVAAAVVEVTVLPVSAGGDPHTSNSFDRDSVAALIRRGLMVGTVQDGRNE